MPFNASLVIATFMQGKIVKTAGQSSIARAVVQQTLTTQLARLEGYIRAVASCLESVWSAQLWLQ